jgi:hypothetical protein
MHHRYFSFAGTFSGLRMTHHFPLDPRSILGVRSDATLEEIERAFRAKSKKHHPDLGGDEWAFRVVARSFEILKSTTSPIGVNVAYAPMVVPAAGSWNGRSSEEAGNAATVDAGWNSTGSYSSDAGSNGEETCADRRTELQPEDIPLPPAEFQTVEVELIWIRFAFTDTPRAPLDQNEAQTTLSVCMVISWPRASLVARAVLFPDASETLRNVIGSFEHSRGQELVLSSRSRIEDGQFVGWLSYPDVVRAMIGYESLKDALSAHQIQVELRTRDEQIPQEWQGR